MMVNKITFLMHRNVCALVLLCEKNIPHVWLGTLVWGFHQRVSRVAGTFGFSWLSWISLLGCYNSGILFPIDCKTGFKQKVTLVPSSHLTILRSVLFRGFYTKGQNQAYNKSSSSVSKYRVATCYPPKFQTTEPNFSQYPQSILYILFSCLLKLRNHFTHFCWRDFLLHLSRSGITHFLKMDVQCLLVCLHGGATQGFPGLWRNFHEVSCSLP